MDSEKPMQPAEIAARGPLADVGASRAEAEAKRPWRLWSGSVFAALVAAIGAWLLEESGLARVAPANAAVPTSGTVVMAPTAATKQVADVKNATRIFGAFGAMLGTLLGLAGGWSRGRLGPSWMAALVGLIAGAVTGAVGPLICVPAYFRWLGAGKDELVYSMMMHSGFWIALGAAAGLAFAIGRGDRSRLAHTALGGVAGAVLGAVFYDVQGATIFPFAQTGDPLPTTALARLVEFVVPGIAIAVGAVIGARG